MSGEPAARSAYTLVIVDDEPLAREGLRDAVGRVASRETSVIALCENGFVALDAIRSAQPDIVLLDVSMPVLDGFAMLEQLEPESTPPAVIFVTAFDEHAVRAFEAEALDFLVKPVSDHRLRAGLERAIRRITEARALRASLDDRIDLPADTTNFRSQIVIPDRGRQHIVPVSDVEWIEGDTYYVRVHARGRVRLLRERLARLEASLDPARFHRTHRSALVRIDLIRELRAESAYTYSALLATGDRVPVSRERFKALEERLKRV